MSRLLLIACLGCLCLACGWIVPQVMAQEQEAEETPEEATAIDFLKRYGDGTRTGSLKRTVLADFTGRMAAISSDGKRLAVVTHRGVIELYSLPGFTKDGPLGAHAEAYELFFSSDGNRIATGAKAGAKLWDVGERRVLLTPQVWRLMGIHADGVLGVSAAGAVLCSAAGDRRLVSTAENCIAISPDGSALVTSCRGVPNLWKAGANEGARLLKVRPAGVTFSPDSRTCVIYGEGISRDRYLPFGAIQVLSVADARELAYIEEPFPVHHCCFAGADRLVSQNSCHKTSNDERDPQGLMCATKVWTLSKPREFQAVREVRADELLFQYDAATGLAIGVGELGPKGSPIKVSRIAE